MILNDIPHQMGTAGDENENNDVYFKSDHLLQLFFACGNHMNGGSHAGLAGGFENDQVVPKQKHILNVKIYACQKNHKKYIDIPTKK